MPAKCTLYICILQGPIWGCPPNRPGKMQIEVVEITLLNPAGIVIYCKNIYIFFKQEKSTANWKTAISLLLQGLPGLKQIYLSHLPLICHLGDLWPGCGGWVLPLFFYKVYVDDGQKQKNGFCSSFKQPNLRPVHLLLSACVCLCSWPVPWDCPCQLARKAVYYWPVLLLAPLLPYIRPS